MVVSVNLDVWWGDSYTDLSAHMQCVIVQYMKCVHVCLPPSDWCLREGSWECVPLLSTESSQSVKSSELKVNLHQRPRPIRPDMKPPEHWHHSQKTPLFLLLYFLPLLLSRFPPLRSRKRCCCQKPAALSTSGGMSLSLPLTLMYTPAYALLRTSHTQKVVPHISLLLHSFPLFSFPRLFSQWPLHSHHRHNFPAQLSMSLLFLTAEYKHVAFA